MDHNGQHAHSPVPISPSSASSCWSSSRNPPARKSSRVVNGRRRPRRGPSSPNPDMLEFAGMLYRDISPRMMGLMQNHLHFFWHQERLNLDNTAVYRHNLFPLTRLKKVMKVNEEVKMISADAPILISKAMELLILEVTLRSWHQTQHCGRRTMERIDVGSAVMQMRPFTFLVDKMPWENMKNEMHEDIARRNWLRI